MQGDGGVDTDNGERGWRLELRDGDRLGKDNGGGRDICNTLNKHN